MTQLEVVLQCTTNDFNALREKYGKVSQELSNIKNFLRRQASRSHVPVIVSVSRKSLRELSRREIALRGSGTIN